VKARRLVVRAGAAVLPVAIVLGSTGTALAAKPQVTPVPVLTAKPANPTNATSATFAWSLASATTYKCALDGAAPVACTSPKAYSALASKAHSFKLTAAATGKRASSLTYGWTVDTVAPVAPVVSRTTPSTTPAASSTASFALSDAATDLGSFQCALDGASYGTCTSPVSLGSLVTGTHVLAVRALDRAGNASPATSSSWAVDLTPPTRPVLAGPGRTSATSPAVGITASSDTASLSCSLDGAAAAACSAPSWTAGSALADGDHTLDVVAADALGNASQPSSVLFTVDTTGPAPATLVSGPASLTSLRDATIAFADDEPSATFTCSVDGGASSPCVSPVALTDLAEAGHTLDVLASDALGNPATSALHVAWTVDAQAPTTPVLLTTPPAYTSSTSASFSWARTDDTSTGFRCSVDGGAYGDCDPAVPGETATGVTLSGLGQGSHTFAVETRDAVPNWSVPVTYTWVVDTTAPTSVAQSAGVPTGSQGSVSSTPTFTFASTDPSVAGFVCSVDGGAWTACASGITPAGGDGAHTLQVATVDQAGNVSTGAPLSYSWTLDTHAPVGALTFPTTLTAPFKVAFAEPVLGVTTSTVRVLLAGTTTVVATAQSCLDGTAAVACGGQVRTVVLAPRVLLVPGQKYVVATSPAVHDLAGNPASSPATVFRALRVLQETQAAVSQGWAARTSTAAFGGRYVQAHLAGDALSYAFRGTTVTWYTETGPAMGTVRVYCGSTLKSTVNDYAAAATWHVARTVRCSSVVANNVLRLVATGQKSTVSKGTHVVLDAVKVGTSLTSNPATTQRWATAASALASGGRYAYADLAGETVSLSFRGTSITWRTLLGKGMGKASVYVDGVLKGSYDQFATTTKAASRTWRLTDKAHTIKVVVTGTHRTGATGNRVVVDLLTVG
jgi:hypothetical protein